ncbi:MAG: FadR family transcriptional regulator, partial [Lentisphaeria bacterium]|nr:FadR family transcriptional regulator [Lentisphaeria bacterium]
ESLEVGFAACMVQRITREELQHLQNVCERFKHAYTPAQLAFTDMEFHIALLESARNPLLTGLIPLVVHFFATSEEPGNNQDPMQEYQRHLMIFEALSSRDGERLTFLLRKHYHPYSGDSVL